MRRAALAAAVALVVPATALAVAPRASFNDLEQQVMCITCHVPLNIAESVQADQERTELKRFVAQGMTKKQVLAAMVSEYGKGILADPPTNGFNITTWLVPAGVVAALLAALAFFVPRWRDDRAESDDQKAGPDLSPTDARKLDEDLARYEV